MALTAQPLDIPLGVGVNQKIVEKLLRPGNLVLAENGYFAKDGEIRKIEGYDLLPQTFYIESQKMRLASGVFFYNGRAYIDIRPQYVNAFPAFRTGALCMGPVLGEYNPDDAGVDMMRVNYAGARRGDNSPLLDVGLERFGVPDADVDSVSCDSAGDFMMRAWEAGGDTTIEVVRVSTGEVVYQEAVLLAYNGNHLISPKVVATKEAASYALLCFGADSADDQICCRIFDVVTATMSTTVFVVHNNVSGVSPWDVAPGYPHGFVHLFYRDATSSTIKHRTVDSAGTASAAEESVAEDVENVLTVSCVSSLGLGFLTWQNATTHRPRYLVANPSDLSITGAGTDISIVTTAIVRIAGCIYGNWAAGVEGTFAVEYAAAAGVPNKVMLYHHDVNMTSSLRHVMFHVGLAGKPFVDRGMDLWPMVSTQALQSTLYLFTTCVVPGAGRPEIVGVIASGYAGRLSTTANHLSNCNRTEDGVVWGTRYQLRLSVDPVIPSAYKARAVPTAQIVYGPAVAKAYFDHLGHTKPLVEIGQQTLRGGAVGSRFDGRQYPATPLEVPETATAVTAAGGSLATGTYNYKLVVEMQDKNGNLCRSATSPAIEVVVAGGPKKVTLSLYLPAPFALRDNESLCTVWAYRTESGGSTYYRTSAFVKVPSYDPTGAAVTLADDTYDDAALAIGEMLYTTGGVLDNEPMPASVAMCASGDRAWLIPSDDPGVVAASKIKTPGSGIGFSSILRKPAGTGGENIGIAAQDGRILLFKRNAIYSMPDVAPDNTGNGLFGDATPLATGIGTVAASGIITTRVGTFFQAASGIHLVDRALQVQFVGAPVCDYTSGVTVQSAHEHPERGEVWFLLSSGRFVIYSLEFQRWSTYEAQSSIADDLFDFAFSPDTGRYIAVSCSFEATASGVVRVQGDTFDADGSAVALRLKTPWLGVGSIQELKRIRWASLLAEWRSTCTINIEVYVDWKETAVQTEAFAATSGYSAGDPLIPRIHLVRQKCEAVRFLIYDSGSGTGEGYRPSILSLEAAVKGSGFKRIAGNSA